MIGSCSSQMRCLPHVLPVDRSAQQRKMRIECISQLTHSIAGGGWMHMAAIWMVIGGAMVVDDMQDKGHHDDRTAVGRPFGI
jgi:hypothetical protein